MMGPVSIRTRLAGWYAATLAAGFALFAGGSYLAVHRSLHAAVDQGLQNRLEATRRFAELELPRVPPGEFARQFQDRVVVAMGHGAAVFQMTDGAGAPLYRAEIFRQAGLRPPAANGLSTTPTFEELELAGREVRLLTAAIDVGGRRFAVQLGTVTDDIEIALRELRWMLVILAPLILFASAAGGYWISGRALAPVDAMSRTARAITVRSLDQRVAVPSTGDELQHLAETLNGMLDRLDAAFENTSRVAADASHELRTPVAVIRSTAEVALAQRRTAEEYQATLGEIVEESGRMSRLLEDLLTLARADRGVDSLPLARVDLAEVVERSRSLAEQMARSCGLDFHVAAPAGPVLVDGNAETLARLLTILTENACRYTPAPGRVEWRVAAEPHDAIIEVDDSGIGIGPEDLPHVFEPFYRADKARSRHSGGAGLGLTIARWTVAKHGGTITAHSDPGGGCRIRVTLPLAAGPAG